MEELNTCFDSNRNRSLPWNQSLQKIESPTERTADLPRILSTVSRLHRRMIFSEWVYRMAFDFEIREETREHRSLEQAGGCQPTAVLIRGDHLCPTSLTLSFSLTLDTGPTPKSTTIPLVLPQPLWTPLTSTTTIERGRARVREREKERERETEAKPPLSCKIDRQKCSGKNPAGVADPFSFTSRSLKWDTFHLFSPD